MRRCTQCLLPENYPGVRFQEEGRCTYCTRYEAKQKRAKDPSGRSQRRKAKLHQSFESYLKATRQKGTYDCLIGLSGGKDSTYLVKLFQETYGLKVLTYTCDTGFLSDVARENIASVVEKLGVAHIWCKPPPDIYRRLYASLVMRPSRKGAVRTVCPKCFALTMLVALKLSVERMIPMVVYGLSPGQLYLPGYRIPATLLMAGTLLFRIRPKTFLGISLSAEEKEWFGFSLRDVARIPDVVLPFRALEYEVGRNTETVIDAGLMKRGNENPLITNCYVNLLMMDLDYRQLGYNPYAWEFSQLLRERKLPLEEWRAIDDRMAQEIRDGVFEREKIDAVLDQLGLREAYARIVRNTAHG